MGTTPQSSRRAKGYSIFPEFAVNPAAKMEMTYNIMSTPTATGKDNVQFRKIENAKAGHYVIIGVAVLASLYFGSKKIGEYIG